MSETFATACHQATASAEPRYGDLLTRSTGCAPVAARSVRNCSRFARYCAVDAVHGVGVTAPNSSFSTTSGVVQPPVRATAFWYCVSAAASSVEGSAGAVGVPTCVASFRLKAYVAAPRALALTE